MENIADKIIKASHDKKSLLVVGLDPVVENLPDFLIEGNTTDDYCEAILKSNKIVIDAVSDHVVAVKPQLAYYEVFGSRGLYALEETIKYAKSKNLIVINDAKRGDIGSTSAAYAEAFLGSSDIVADMVTVNPYMGEDSYNPFIKKAKETGRGLFLLLKTSNPSSKDLQDLILENGNSLYMHLADKINKITEGTIGEKGFSFIGAVVGATHPEESKALRDVLPNTLFLMPGFGHQGGDVSNVKALLNNNGDGILCSSSRGVIFSYMGADNWKKINESTMFAEINNAALKLKEEINKIRN